MSGERLAGPIRRKYPLSQLSMGSPWAFDGWPVVPQILGMAGFFEWVKVLIAETRSGSSWGILRVFRGILRGALFWGIERVMWWRYPKVSREEWVERVRWCEERCPIYDKGLKRCRPYDGSKLGCGCYVPYLAWIREPYRGSEGVGSGGCWGDVFVERKVAKASEVGWKVAKGGNLNNS